MIKFCLKKSGAKKSIKVCVYTFWSKHTIFLHFDIKIILNLLNQILKMVRGDLLGWVGWRERGGGGADWPKHITFFVWL